MSLKQMVFDRYEPFVNKYDKVNTKILENHFLLL